MPISETGKPMSSVQNGKIRTEDGNNRIISSDDSGTDILLIGQRNDGTLGVDLSQPGVDVKSAADEQLIWSSKFNTFKIVDSGEFSINVAAINSPGGAEQGYTQISHDLGYIPAILIYQRNDITGFWEAVSSGVYSVNSQVRSNGTVQYISTITFHIYADDTNLTASIFHVVNGDSTGTSLAAVTYDFKYYLLRESLTP